MLLRFIAGRGMPTIIWSDNAENLVGSAKEIKKWISNPELFDYCAHQGISCKFMLEHTPHSGGLREVWVKSFKEHLRKVVGEGKLRYGGLATTLAQIEACINSRPRTPVPEDSEGLEVLTPGRFLIRKPLTALPDPPESHL